MNEQQPIQKRPRGVTQNKILDYINEQIDSRGYPPSVREICDALNIKSTSTVHGHLKRMEAKGLLVRDAMKPRAIGVVKNVVPHEESKFSTVPLVGTVAAGLPILAEENIEDQLELPDFMLSRGEHFALTVRGDSMITAGIMNGDTIVVHRQQMANNGDIVVALVQGDATVKRFYKENGHFRLQPENPAMAPIYTPSVDILGKVVSVFRVLR